MGKDDTTRAYSQNDGDATPRGVPSSDELPAMSHATLETLSVHLAYISREVAHVAKHCEKIREAIARQDSDIRALHGRVKVLEKTDADSSTADLPAVMSSPASTSTTESWGEKMAGYALQAVISLVISLIVMGALVGYFHTKGASLP